MHACTIYDIATTASVATIKLRVLYTSGADPGGPVPPPPFQFFLYKHENIIQG